MEELGLDGLQGEPRVNAGDIYHSLFFGSLQVLLSLSRDLFSKMKCTVKAAF